jgi:hypothetical protein
VGGTSAFWGPSLPTGDYIIFWDTKLKYDETAASYLEELGMFNSAYADPEFVDPDNLVFIPKSTGGRYDPVTDAIVTDAVHSIAVDFASPAKPVASEPSPNGGRVNAGAYGGTSWASRSAGQPYLATISLNDGGGISGTSAVLRWHHGGFASNATVSVEYLPDLTTNWLPVAALVPVTNAQVNWPVGPLEPMAARWRVISDEDPEVLAATPRRFSINGFKVPYFVNDNSTSNDVYTTAVGNDSNDGLTPSTPKLTLTNLLAAYRFGGYDRIYVDTGVYSNYTVIVPFSAGGSEVSGYFSIMGSTDRSSGGTIFDRGSSATDSIFIQPGFVEIRHLTIRNGAGVRYPSGFVNRSP